MYKRVQISEAAILLIEDNNDHAELLLANAEQMTLIRSSFSRVSCLSEAEDFLKENNCDLILLDLGLPESVGIDTLSNILSISKSIPIIVLTADENKDLIPNIAQLGAYDYISKGSVNSELLEKSIIYTFERAKFIEELKDKNESLSSALAENEVLLKEVHHRVKNNLQIIMSLLKIRSENADNQTFKQLVTECSSQINSMLLIHDKLYCSNLLAEIDLAEYITSLVQDIVTLYHFKETHITKEIKLNSIKVPLTQALPVGLILNEILVNVYKHAFPENSLGKLTINLNQQGDSVCLKISDDGQGFEFSDNEKGSFGLQLVDMLAMQISAESEVSSKLNEGTSFKLNFQLA